MKTNLEERARFDGMNRRINTDQYLESCQGGAINLHIYQIGNYLGCNSCEYKPKCLESASVAGEQAEL